MIEGESQPYKNTEILILFRQDYSNLLQRQIAGERILFVTPDDIKNLLEKISTDGILPSRAAAHFKPEDLSDFALSGVAGITEGSIKNNNFGTIIVGSGFGGGSAREHAPLALQGSGIETIIVLGRAEEIFKENCLFLGGPQIQEIEPNSDKLNDTIRKIREGETIKQTFNDPIRRLIYENGGLFNFTKRRIRGEISLPAISHPKIPDKHPMTSVEKILAMNFLNIDERRIVVPGDIGFAKTSLRFSYEIFTGMIIRMLQDNLSKDWKERIRDKDSIIFFEDHTVFAKEKFSEYIDRQRKIAEELGIRLEKQKEGLEGSLGICHTLIVENGLLRPGEIGIGTDSHTCSAGVLGAFAFGVGATAMANSLITKDVLVEVPETILVSIEGKLPRGCSAKDVMLKILSDPYLKSGKGIGKVLEFSGNGISEWPIDQLFVLTNMAVESGTRTGIIPYPTDAVIDHFKSLGIKEKQILESFAQIQSDPNAHFSHEIKIDLTKLEPMIALPHHPSNSIPISEIGKIKITSGYIGSCTGGNLSDLESAAQILKNGEVKVPLYVQVASMNVWQKAKDKGILEIIESAGGTVLLPGCGACIGMGPGRIQSPEDVIISDTNRNFYGRMGMPAKGEGGKTYLASSSVVAKSCLNGYISAP